VATTSNVTSTSSILDQLNTRTSTDTGAVSEQQSRFLKLLTTQLKNQDPLNPMENAEMTSQIAQISTVDGIERLNATLSSMMSGTSTSQALQAAALVGHGALVKGTALELGESGAIAGFDLASGADTVKIEIKNAAGAVVRTVTLEDQDAGVRNFVWDGKDDLGAAVAAGSYKFAVTARQGSNDVTVDPLQFGYVSGVVRTADGGISVDIGSYGRFKFDDIKQII